MSTEPENVAFGGDVGKQSSRCSARVRVGALVSRQKQSRARLRHSNTCVPLAQPVASFANLRTVRK